MILPNQIEDHEFTYAKGMYKASEVDEFLKEVAASFDQTFRENGELVKKLEILADKVEEYRNDEDNIRVALLAAQRAANQLTKEAKDKSEEVMAQTKAQADKTASEANGYADKTVADANEKAENILAEAQAQAAAVIKAGNDEAAKIEAEYRRNKKIEEVALDAMKKESAKFKAELLSMYKTHISLINEIPSLIKIDESEFEERVVIQPVDADSAAQDSQEAEEPEAQQQESEPEIQQADEPQEAVPEEISQPESEEEPAEVEPIYEEAPEEEAEEGTEEADDEEPEEAEKFDDEEPVKTVVAQQKRETDAVSGDEDYAEPTEEPEEQSDTAQAEKAVPRKQSFEEAFAAFFNDNDEEEEDFSDLEELDDDIDLGDDFDDKDFDMFGDDEGTEEPENGDTQDGHKGFGRFFKKK